MIWHTIALLLGAFLTLLGFCGFSFACNETTALGKTAALSKHRFSAGHFVTLLVSLGGVALMQLAWMGLRS